MMLGPVNIILITYAVDYFFARQGTSHLCSHTT